MKKKWIVPSIAGALLAVTITVIAANLFFTPHSFHESYGAKGGMAVTIQAERTLSYGTEPPAADGRAWDHPFTDEISALLEGHSYQRALADSPADGGVLFRSCDGSLADEAAYWDREYLWIASRGGWLPYTPSEGFYDRVMIFLYKHPEIVQQDWSDSNG